MRPVSVTQSSSIAWATNYLKISHFPPLTFRFKLDLFSFISPGFFRATLGQLQVSQLDPHISHNAQSNFTYFFII